MLWKDTASMWKDQSVWWKVRERRSYIGAVITRPMTLLTVYPLVASYFTLQCHWLKTRKRFARRVSGRAEQPGASNTVESNTPIGVPPGSPSIRLIPSPSTQKRHREGVESKALPRRDNSLDSNDKNSRRNQLIVPTKTKSAIHVRILSIFNGMMMLFH